MEILDLTREELLDALIEKGFEKYRAAQIFQWIYDKFVFDFSLMTNISKEKRESLKNYFSINMLNNVEMFSSADGTEKIRLTLDDSSSVESVIIPDKDRVTLCVSTQVGCPLDCKFCRTGHLGFKRNLTVREIVAQVLFAQKYLHEKEMRITNIVYMGMGEPLLNFDNTIKSIMILKDGVGLNFSSRRITVSTAGITDLIVELGEKTGVNFALSLHSPNQKIRETIMPVAKRFPLEQLIEAVKNYPNHHRKRVLIEYIMLKGINDSKDDARRLIKIAKFLNAKVNLIPFNSFEGCGFVSTKMGDIESFQQILADSYITVLIRKSRGEESLAACGQLGHI